MKRVLILDADQRSALAVTRSLGKHAVPVLTADETPLALAGCSRFSQQYFTYPSPRLTPELFISTVATLIREQHIELLLPMTELTTTLLLGHENQLSGVVLPFPDLNTVDCLADKCSLMRLAKSLNIPVPRTWYADHPDALPCNLEELHYPVVIKPGKSWLYQNGQWSRAAVRVAGSQLEAKEILASDAAFHAYPFMIQEYIAGHGEGVFALYNKGEALAFFAHRRLREKPPSGGVSVLSESIAVDPVLRSHACALLDSVAWHGIAMVEFKISADGTPYLMEINTRFWGSLQLAIDAGVDFPWLLYQLVSGNHLAQVNEYRTGIRLRWLLGDLDNLYLTLRDKNNPYQMKLRAVLRFLQPAPFRTRHEVNRWNDLGPFRYELGKYIRDILK
jgi:predicted ATP-grasp superfamily ATP-dependent carboligase